MAAGLAAVCVWSVDDLSLQVWWCGRSTRRVGLRLRTAPTWTWLMTSPEESGCTDRTTPRSRSTPSCTAAGTRYFSSSDECLFIFHLFKCFCLSNKISGMLFSFQPHLMISFTRSSSFFWREFSHLTVKKKFLWFFSKKFLWLFVSLVLSTVLKLFFQRFEIWRF